MIEGVTIEQLRTLRAVAEAGSFSAAARKLGRVQAAVSQTIDRLEAQLGLRLFDRSGRASRLTRHGEAIVAAAMRVGAEIDSLDTLVESLRSGAETELSIVVDGMFPTAALVSFAKDFAREHPTAALGVLTDTLTAVTAHVREKRAVLGVAVEDADLRDLERRAIAELDLLPVAAAEHPLAKRKGRISIEDLAGSVQIVLGEHRQEADRKDDVHGVLSSRLWRVVDLATKHALIASGLGWGQLPEHVVREDLRTGRLVSLELDAWGGVGMRRSLVLVWRGGAVIGPVTRWAIAHLTKLCQAEMGHHVA